ncbi:MAG: anion transporter [candidate division KSB1 bacterium]|nr:anion transporter [candidate division KSB1 bacterium]MDZ7274748.1 anion transporter [candidate division KSB1 bacterium]MDZ7285573.1 anion transporter [candidate division KSB1 bacterium]MDZ7298605.1 anion transporter [candidate division KSB1 bacterium]MDZ7349469.1 anion transporter [candidate division KSB1 bacterium]
MSLNSLVVLIFVATYLGIAGGRLPGLQINRTGIAILGAIMMMVAGALSVEQATTTIDYSTLLLLFGLMILSAQLRVAGFYRLVARQVLAFAHRPFTLLIGIVLASAVLSGVFANDIVCLAFTPVLCEVAQTARRNPLPYLIALATSSNIGSVATLIGNPQNMFIGQISGLDFGQYSLLLAPVTLFGVAANVLVVRWIYRAEFTAGHEPAGPAMLPHELTAFKPDYRSIKKTLLITGLLLVAFLLGWRRDLCALAAAALLLPSRRNPSEKLFALVDWNLIMLFIALFVIIGTLQQRGLMAQALAGLVGAGIHLDQPVVFVTLCTLLSNLVSNVPAVLLMQDIPGEASRLWYLLALASTLAGNLTLLGSIANLIVAEKAASYGITLSFQEYVKVGLPLTLITVTAGTLWILFAT